MLQHLWRSLLRVVFSCFFGEKETKLSLTAYLLGFSHHLRTALWFWGVVM